MTDERSSSWVSWAFKGLLLMLLTVIPASGVLFLLLLFPWVPSQWTGNALLLVGFVFLFGAGSLLLTKNLRSWLYSLVIGLLIGVGCIALATLVLLSWIPVPLFGNALNVAVLVVTMIGLTVPLLLRRKTGVAKTGLITTSSKSIGDKMQSYSTGGMMFKRDPEKVLAIELKEIPHDYAFDEEGRNNQTTMVEQFHNIIRSLSAVPFALRIERIRNRTRVFFLTWSKDEALLEHQRTVMHDALKENLSGFKFDVLDSFSGLALAKDDKGSAAIVNGIPLSVRDEAQRKDPLDPMTGVLQDLERGVFQVSFEPTQVSKRKLRSLKARYEEAEERSQTTKIRESGGLFSGPHQESKTVVNLDAKLEAERLEKRHARLSSQKLFQTTVSMVSWAPDIASADLEVRRIAFALSGTVRPSSRDDELTVDYRRKDKEIARLLNGLPTGKSSVLTAEEATVYLILPRRDIGIRTTKREKFSSGTREPSKKASSTMYQSSTFESLVPSTVMWKKRSPSLYLGNPMDENGNIQSNVYVKSEPDHMDMHLGVLGGTRMGKSTSVKSIIGQAITLGVNPVVLVPSKGYEWRWLLKLFPDLRVFTCGRTNVANLSINIWNPPEGVRLTKWVDRVVQVWTLWMPNEKVISMHIEDVIYTVYKKCGWDLETNTKGRPILLTDLVDAVREVGEKLPYGDEVTSNIWGALVARVKSILRKPSLVKMYNTSTGITVSELLAHPTIIEMDDLSENDKILLIGVLTAALSEYKLANPSRRVTNLLVLEEAHYLLGGSDLSGEANSGVRLQAVSAFIQMLRVLGGTGLGVILIDQSPSTLVSQAIKIPVNLVIHALPHEDDRTMVGKHSRCTASQIDHIGGMQVGEAVIYLQHEGEPKNVKICPLRWFIHGEVPEEDTGDDIVENHMSRVFDEHPEFRESEPLPEDIMDLLTTTRVPDNHDWSHRIPRESRERMRAAVESGEFERYFRENLGKEDIGALTELIRKTSEIHGGGSSLSNLYVLDLALEYLDTEKDRDVFNHVTKALDGETGE
ncbi:MAG: helicase HerA domain-containing protein [Candidatus Thorarchaeota archaeon]